VPVEGPLGFRKNLSSRNQETEKNRGGREREREMSS